MPIAFILLVIGAVFVVGGIKNWSIANLLLGKVVDRGGSSGALGSSAGGTTTDSTTTTTQDPTKNNIVNIAKGFLNTPYKYGGNDRNIGIDCSRFVQLVYQQVGIQLDRTTFQQFNQGKAVSFNDLQPGDVIFTESTPSGPNHEGLYIGNGQVQESPHTGEVNKIIPIQSFLSGGLVGVRRYI